jgi:hypothetical protein
LHFCTLRFVIVESLWPESFQILQGWWARQKLLISPSAAARLESLVDADIGHTLISAAFKLSVTEPVSPL